MDQAGKIDGIQKDIHHIDGNIGILQAQLKTLQQQLQDRKNKYIRSMRYKNAENMLDNDKFYLFLNRLIGFIWAYAISNPGITALRAPVFNPVKANMES